MEIRCISSYYRTYTINTEIFVLNEVVNYYRMFYYSQRVIIDQLVTLNCSLIHLNGYIFISSSVTSLRNVKGFRSPLTLPSILTKLTKHLRQNKTHYIFYTKYFDLKFWILIKWEGGLFFKMTQGFFFDQHTKWPTFIFSPIRFNFQNECGMNSTHRK